MCEKKHVCLLSETSGRWEEACERKTCKKKHEKKYGWRNMHEKTYVKNMQEKIWEKKCVKKHVRKKCVKKHVRKTCVKKHVRKNMHEKTYGKKHGRKNIARKNMRKNMCAHCQRWWAQCGRWQGHIRGMWEKNMCKKHVRKTCMKNMRRTCMKKTYVKNHVRKNMWEKTREKKHCKKKHCKKKHVRKNMWEKTCVLAVRDDELSMGDDETHHCQLPRGWTCTGFLGDHMVGPGLVMWSQLAGPRFLRGPRNTAGVASAKDFYIYICYCHIHVLLTKTNLMIYNMSYKIWV